MRTGTREKNIMICVRFQCLGFNHKARDCTNRKACGKCGGNHEMKEWLIGGSEMCKMCRISGKENN